VRGSCFDFECGFAAREDDDTPVVIDINGDYINQFAGFIKKLAFDTDIFPTDVTLVGQSSNYRYPKIGSRHSLAELRADDVNFIAISCKLFFGAKYLVGKCNQTNETRTAQQRI